MNHIWQLVLSVRFSELSQPNTKAWLCSVLLVRYAKIEQHGHSTVTGTYTKNYTCNTYYFQQLMIFITHACNSRFSSNCWQTCSVVSLRCQAAIFITREKNPAN